MAIITFLLLVFIAAGLAKLINPAMFHDQFARFGLPEWFVLVTGATELVAAALIASFNDVRRRLGGAMLAVTMAVATALHVLHDPLPMAVPAFLLMLLAAYVALVALAKSAKTRPVSA
jgi:hypothetical protein